MGRCWSCQSQIRFPITVSHVVLGVPRAMTHSKPTTAPCRKLRAEYGKGDFCLLFAAKQWAVVTWPGALAWIRLSQQVCIFVAQECVTERYIDSPSCSQDGSDLKVGATSFTAAIAQACRGLPHCRFEIGQACARTRRTPGDDMAMYRTLLPSPEGGGRFAIRPGARDARRPNGAAAPLPLPAGRHHSWQGPRVRPLCAPGLISSNSSAMSGMRGAPRSTRSTRSSHAGHSGAVELRAFPSGSPAWTTSSQHADYFLGDGARALPAPRWQMWPVWQQQGKTTCSMRVDHPVHASDQHQEGKQVEPPEWSNAA